MSIVLKSGSLNLLEPSGPVQGCNGLAVRSEAPFHITPDLIWTLCARFWVSQVAASQFSSISKTVGRTAKQLFLEAITRVFQTPDDRSIYRTVCNLLDSLYYWCSVWGKGCTNKKVFCSCRDQFTVDFLQNIAIYLSLLWDKPRGRVWW
jgi:hypothetical protein